MDTTLVRDPDNGGVVYVGSDGNVVDLYSTGNYAAFTPAKARELADVLSRAADEAEGVTTPRPRLKDIPADKPPQEARDHMRTHVYVNLHVTERKTDGRGYTGCGYRKWVERDAWHNVSDAERSAALTEMINSVARNSGRPEEN